MTMTSVLLEGPVPSSTPALQASRMCAIVVRAAPDPRTRLDRRTRLCRRCSRRTCGADPDIQLDSATGRSDSPAPYVAMPQESPLHPFGRTHPCVFNRQAARGGSCRARPRGLCVYCPTLVSSSVALFLPFRCTKERQTAAKGGTKRNSKIVRFSLRRCPIRQRPAHRGKARLTAFFPPVNRRVAGSSPARGATHSRFALVREPSRCASWKRIASLRSALAVPSPARGATLQFCPHSRTHRTA